MADPSVAAPPGAEKDIPSHRLRKELGLRDLIPMQVLLVLGTNWPGVAAREGSTHVTFWLLGVGLFFLPVAGVVQYCTRLWPYEGGVYQWAKNALGPFYGFWSAWNFGLWALLIASSMGLITAASLSYALGPSWSWITESKTFLASLNVGLFAFLLLVNVPGLRIGRWVAHFGTAVTLLVTSLLVALIFIHPGATPAHPHISPQPPFSLALPTLTLASLNLFSKLAFNGLTGLEQVAVFAGETRNAARTILRSAWIAAPFIALIYILESGSMLTYTAADHIDLVGPIPQVLAAGFGSASAASTANNLGPMLGRCAILALAIAAIAQFSVIIAETARLPLVAAWDHLLPQWFTELHPRYRTPDTRARGDHDACRPSWPVRIIQCRLTGSLSGACYGGQLLVRNQLPADVRGAARGRRALWQPARNSPASSLHCRGNRDDPVDGLCARADRRCQGRQGVCP